MHLKTRWLMIQYKLNADGCFPYSTRHGVALEALLILFPGKKWEQISLTMRFTGVLCWRLPELHSCIPLAGVSLSYPEHTGFLWGPQGGCLVEILEITHYVSLNAMYQSTPGSHAHTHACACALQCFGLLHALFCWSVLAWYRVA